jgi:glycosyltransferase involved in cell wall biosynthesis
MERETIVIRGYFPHKYSGKQKYFDYLFRNKRSVELIHKYFSLGRISSRLSPAIKFMDFKIFFSIKVFLYLVYIKIIRKDAPAIIVDSQENLFISPILELFGLIKKSTLIFYDSASLSSDQQKYLVKYKKIICMTKVIKKEIIQMVPQIKSSTIQIVSYKIKKYVQSFSENLPPTIQPFKYILYVGSEQPRKNFLTTLKAFNILAKQHSDLQFVKVGKDQSLVNRIKLNNILISHLELRSKFNLIEVCSDTLLQSLYKNALCLVFPSLYEGFGIPLVEAMAAKCPIVASNIPTTKEICGRAALYVNNNTNPNDYAKIIFMLSKNRKIRDQYSNKSWLRSFKYTY